jgi:hypothetical protein
MKLFIDDIKRYDWLVDSLKNTHPIASSWGNKFLELKKGAFFVIYYDINVKVQVLQIKEVKVVYELNDSIYRGLVTYGAQNLAYIQEPFETSTQLLYLLLKTAIIEAAIEEGEREKKLDDLFFEFKAKDIEQSKNNIKINIRGSQDIESRIGFNNALLNIFYLNKDVVTGLQMVYDLIESYFVNNLGKSFYGNYLTKIVRAYKSPNGGLINEMGGTMRYLIVGEKAYPNDPDLIEAKKMFRSGTDLKTIFYQTKWFYNKKDFKWRKRISDESFYINMDNLEKLPNEFGSFISMPSGNIDPQVIVRDFKALSNGSQDTKNLIQEGYDAKTEKFFNHKKLYELYPNFKNIFAFLGRGKDFTSSYYFSPTEPKSIVLIDSNSTDIFDYSNIGLHEIQHYIQSVEGFSSGGNTFLASILDKVGGGAVRAYFASLEACKKRFKDVADFIPFEDFKSLVKSIEDVKYKDYEFRYQAQLVLASQYRTQIVNSLKTLTVNPLNLKNNEDSFFSLIMGMYTTIPETSSVIGSFVKKHLGNDYIDVFEQSLMQNKNVLAKESSLLTKGWTPRDLYILNFNAYQSILGEIEARFTQTTQIVPESLNDYFEFYTGETINPNDVIVNNESIFYEETETAEAALETYDDGKYVLHLPDVFSNTLNLLHETGHILFDIANKELEFTNQQVENTEIALSLGFKNLEEYFCASFVDYIHRKNIEQNLTEDLNSERQILDYKAFDEVFEKILYDNKIVMDEAKLVAMLNYVKELSKII